MAVYNALRRLEDSATENQALTRQLLKEMQTIRARALREAEKERLPGQNRYSA
jgi:hypothetical protein